MCLALQVLVKRVVLAMGCIREFHSIWIGSRVSFGRAINEMAIGLSNFRTTLQYKILTLNREKTTNFQIVANIIKII